MRGDKVFGTQVVRQECSFSYCDVRQDDHILTISLEDNPSAQQGDLFSTYNPFVICQFLKSQQKDQYGEHKVIEIKEDDLKICHFHFGLRINGTRSIHNRYICPIPFSASRRAIGDKNVARQEGCFDYKSVFHKPLIIVCSFFERLTLANCEFLDSVEFGLLKEFNKVEFHNGMDLANCKFHKNVDFSNLVSGTPDEKNPYRYNARQTTFESSKFLSNANFSKMEVYNDIFFDNAIFEDRVDFSGSRFYKPVSFYGVTFRKPPNFSRVIFESHLNLVNSKFACDFDQIKEFLQKEIDERQDGTFEFSSLANDYRDSFRLMKNALLKSNNALDASIYHRAELYCKEIELDGKPDSEKFFRDKVDLLILKFYRHTSDHHTDLPKILSWVLTTIGLFGAMLYIFHYGFDLDGFLDIHSKVFMLKQILSENQVLIKLYILIYLGFMCWFKPPSSFKQVLGHIGLCLSLLIVFVIICIDPKYILGIATLFEANRSECTMFWLENLLIVMYIIAIFLLLFSLQKTARKNSIVVS